MFSEASVFHRGPSGYWHLVAATMSYHEFLLPAANGVCEGNVFTAVCDPVHGEGGWISSMHHRSYDHGVPPPRGGESASGRGGFCIHGCLPRGGLHLGGLGRLPPSPEQYGIRSTSGRYASFWNAFLFTICSVTANFRSQPQGGHGTGKTDNLVHTFSRQGKHREFCSSTGKNLLTQGKYLDCDY